VLHLSGRPVRALLPTSAMGRGLSREQARHRASLIWAGEGGQAEPVEGVHLGAHYTLVAGCRRLPTFPSDKLAMVTRTIVRQPLEQPKSGKARFVIRNR
jgi:hypothetical protein